MSITLSAPLSRVNVKAQNHIDTSISDKYFIYITYRLGGGWLIGYKEHVHAMVLYNHYLQAGDKYGVLTVSVARGHIVADNTFPCEGSAVKMQNHYFYQKPAI